MPALLALEPPNQMIEFEAILGAEASLAGAME